MAVVFADALVRAGRARHVLVAVGGGWSRAVSTTTAQAVSAADGAAAVIVGAAAPGRRPRWRVVDNAVIAQEMKFGEMGLYATRLEDAAPDDPGIPAADPTRRRFTGPHFQIKPGGLRDFTVFDGETAPQAALRVIARRGIKAKDLTFTGHQASFRLFDDWKTALATACLFETLKSLGNMTVATIAVNLCLMDARETVTTPYVLDLALAPDMHAHALPPRRAG